MLSYLVVFIIIAVGMQLYSNRKIAGVLRQTHGVIRSQQDLLAIRAAINLNIKLAVMYILLFVLFILLMAISVARGGSLGQAALSLSVFGAVTLPVGLIGKSYEKKIKTMLIESTDPEIAEKFRQYLKQWNEPRWDLKDD